MKYYLSCNGSMDFKASAEGVRVGSIEGAGLIEFRSEGIRTSN